MYKMLNIPLWKYARNLKKISKQIRYLERFKLVINFHLFFYYVQKLKKKMNNIEYIV